MRGVVRQNGDFIFQTVFGNRHGVIQRCGRVVFRLHLHAHSSRCRQSVAVFHNVSEFLHAVKIRRRTIQHRGFTKANLSSRGTFRNGNNGQRFLDVGQDGVVDKNGNRSQIAVFPQSQNVVDRRRRIVDGFHHGDKENLCSRAAFIRHMNADLGTSMLIRQRFNDEFPVFSGSGQKNALRRNQSRIRGRKGNDQILRRSRVIGNRKHPRTGTLILQHREIRDFGNGGRPANRKRSGDRLKRRVGKAFDGKPQCGIVGKVNRGR